MESVSMVQSISMAEGKEEFNEGFLESAEYEVSNLQKNGTISSFK